MRSRLTTTRPHTAALTILLIAGCERPAPPPPAPDTTHTAATHTAATHTTAGATTAATPTPPPPRLAEAVATLDLVALQRAGKLDGLEVVEADISHDPAYDKKPKKYKGYRLTSILKKLLPGGIDPAVHEVRLSALDGFTVTVPMRQLLDDRGVVAFADREAPAGPAPWLTFRQGKREVTPAPFYLVWPGVPYGPEKPWPYQLATIAVVSTAQAYGRAYPTHAPQVAEGFATFKARCMSCHSVNLSGGTLGPELNVPRNITEYWDEAHIRGLIRAPRSYRARSIMPAFGDLTDAQLDGLLAYLKAMKDAKACEDATACDKL